MNCRKGSFFLLLHAQVTGIQRMKCGVVSLLLLFSSVIKRPPGVAVTKVWVMDRERARRAVFFMEAQPIDIQQLLLDPLYLQLRKAPSLMWISPLLRFPSFYFHLYSLFNSSDIRVPPHTLFQAKRCRTLLHSLLINGVACHYGSLGGLFARGVRGKGLQEF
jgi:hypothetical protein